MSQTIKEVRDSQETHTVYVVYENGKPLNAKGRIAYERPQDAKGVITHLCNAAVQRKLGYGVYKRSPEFQEALKEARTKYTIVCYRAAEPLS